VWYRLRNYVVVLFDRNEEGNLTVGEAKEVPPSASAAERKAQSIARTHAGAVAFSRLGDPSIGDFQDAVILAQFVTPQRTEQAGRLGLEGIVSKRRDARYRSGRVKEWLKIKCGCDKSSLWWVTCPRRPPAGLLVPSRLL
jgi:hypothetical protein